MAPDTNSITILSEADNFQGFGTNVTNETSCGFYKWVEVSTTNRNEVVEELLMSKKEKQKFGKPLSLIGNPVSVQKQPYLNHRRNSARV